MAKNLYINPGRAIKTSKGGDAILKKIRVEEIKYILYSDYDDNDILLDKAQRWHCVTGCYNSYSEYTERLTGYLGPRIHTFFYVNSESRIMISIDDIIAAAKSWPPRESLLSKEDLKLMQIPV